jgi:hypothetical protein
MTRASQSDGGFEQAQRVCETRSWSLVWCDEYLGSDQRMDPERNGEIYYKGRVRGRITNRREFSRSGHRHLVERLPGLELISSRAFMIFINAQLRGELFRI